ncbi:hypothetical protein PAL_GLEAN10018959 [Pteropus alecto]|uniref:Uncharacterized protein n=1 Tax=Pteropus alecto TaxID=9402 RepID=L5L130_PTEAL|nr:hypothetical protein PAL_GLEAN10018959 [Pteropus alecto]
MLRASAPSPRRRELDLLAARRGHRVVVNDQAGLTCRLCPALVSAACPCLDLSSDTPCRPSSCVSRAGAEQQSIKAETHDGGSWSGALWAPLWVQNVPCATRECGESPCPVPALHNGGGKACP